MGGVDANRQVREKLKHEFVDIGEADVLPAWAIRSATSTSLPVGSGL
jgi:hypothetical protein